MSKKTAKRSVGSMSETEAVLLQAKDWTRKTGIVADVQATQLKLWPFALFGPTNVLEARIDPLDTEGKVAHYHVMVKRIPNREVFRKRVSLLGKWLRSLLGNDWEGRVRIVNQSGGQERTATAPRTEDLPETPGQKYGYTDALTTFKRYRLRDE